MDVKESSDSLESALNQKDLSNTELLNESKNLIGLINDNIEKLNHQFNESCSIAQEQQIELLTSSNQKLIELYSTLLTKVEYQKSTQHLTEVISNHSEAVSTSTIKLVNAINVIPDGSYSLAITSGVIGAIVASFAAFFANFFYQNHVNKNNKIAHFADVAIALLNDFEKTATEYWISDKKKDKRNKNINEVEMKLLEIKIKSEFKVLKDCLEEFQVSIPSSKQPHKDHVIGFIDAVYDIATGGDFESDNKKSEKAVAVSISKKCSSLKSMLLKYSQHTT